MRKFSVFFCVFSLVLVFLVSGAFAADDDIIGYLNGSPVTTLQGVTFVAGDVFRLTGTYDSGSSSISIPQGVKFVVEPGSRLQVRYLESYGFLVVDGIVSNNSNSPVKSYLIRLHGGTFDMHGAVVNMSRTGGSAISYTDPSVIASFWGGSVYGLETALGIFTSAGTNNISVFGTVFSNSNSYVSDLIITPSSDVISLGYGQSIHVDGHSLLVTAGPLYSITMFVQSAVSWVLFLVSAIVANKLLLIWMLVVFIGLGIGLFRRTMYS